MQRQWSAVGCGPTKLAGFGLLEERAVPSSGPTVLVLGKLPVVRCLELEWQCERLDIVGLVAPLFADGGGSP